MLHEPLSKAAEELKKRWDALEKIRFINSGTEATMHAIRIARTYSGCDKLPKIEGTGRGPAVHRHRTGGDHRDDSVFLSSLLAVLLV